MHFPPRRTICLTAAPPNPELPPETIATTFDSILARGVLLLNFDDQVLTGYNRRKDLFAIGHSQKFSEDPMRTNLHSKLGKDRMCSWQKGHFPPQCLNFGTPE
mmetsp:Transcript_1112/g.2456  ORF Transcript_1112/g.2456 Transcript_1112/m.2456 type:complete len:103 (+) Transcript_1112:794-1102(+)